MKRIIYFFLSLAIIASLAAASALYLAELINQEEVMSKEIIQIIPEISIKDNQGRIKKPWSELHDRVVQVSVYEDLEDELITVLAVDIEKHEVFILHEDPIKQN